MVGPPAPNDPAFAYYHGTADDSAVSLARDGIREPALQANDRGFFGKGFYVSQSFLHAKHYGRAVVEVEVPDSAKVFPAYELLQSGSSTLVRTGRNLPSWYTNFMNYYIDSVRQAAVWERVPDASKEEVISNARSEVNPSSPDFDRERLYTRVTRYAGDKGFDIVEWNEHENIIVNFDIPTGFVGENEVAESALREARQRGEL